MTITAREGRPLLSVLITTRNRPTLSVSTTQAALVNAPAWAEVIVAENSDPGVAPALEGPPSERLRILPRPAPPLPMSENWERLVAAARGEWLMVLSDKYHLVPGGVARLEPILRSPGVSVVSYGVAKLVQALPHDGQRSTAAELLAAPGRLDYAAPSAPRAQWRPFEPHRREWLERCDYESGRAMLYTALVRREVIERIRHHAGRVFLGAAPDIASGLQLALEVPRYLRVGLPLVLMQWPSSNPAPWSAGVAVALGAPEAKVFHRFEGQPTRGLPPTLASVAFATTEAVMLARNRAADLPRRARWLALSESSTRQLLDNHPSGETVGALRDLALKAASEHALPSALRGMARAALEVSLRPARSRLDPVIRKLLAGAGLRARLQRRRGTARSAPRLESSHANVASALQELAELWASSAAELSQADRLAAP